MIYRGSAPIAARTLPSQHSCFGVPLKSQHRCDFLTLHARGSRWSQIYHFWSLTELISVYLYSGSGYDSEYGTHEHKRVGCIHNAIPVDIGISDIFVGKGQEVQSVPEQSERI